MRGGLVGFGGFGGSLKVFFERLFEYLKCCGYVKSGEIDLLFVCESFVGMKYLIASEF